VIGQGGQQQQRSAWEYVRRTERRYASWLRRIADHVAAIVRAFSPGDPDVLPHLTHTLYRYSDGIEPWARAMAARMTMEVAARDARAWFRAGRDIGKSLRQEINETPLGHVTQTIIHDQVELIQSIPRQEAERVQTLTLAAVGGGKRYSEVVPEILRTNEVTRNRAILIARTEVGKAQAAIVEARARFVGVTHFYWMTVRDADVRPLHQKLHGKVFALDDPPIIGEKGERGLPGTIYNCRCWSDMIIAPP